MTQKKIIFIQYYKTTIGEVIVGSYENQICVLDYRYRKMRSQIDKRIQTGLNAVYLEKEIPLLRATRLQIKDYLMELETCFHCPLK
jgi:methylated-DNA-[protein]-cysteine S-methyltransferase